jgi:hypothetical protein
MRTRINDPDVENPHFEPRLKILRRALIVLGAFLVAAILAQSCSDECPAAPSPAPIPDFVPVKVGGIVTVRGDYIRFREDIVIYMDPWTASELGLKFEDEEGGD